MVAVEKRVEEAMKPCCASDQKQTIRKSLEELQEAAAIIAGAYMHNSPECHRIILLLLFCRMQ